MDIVFCHLHDVALQAVEYLPVHFFLLLGVVFSFGNGFSDLGFATFAFRIYYSDIDLRDVLEISETRHWLDVIVLLFRLVVKYHLREVVHLFAYRDHSLF